LLVFAFTSTSSSLNTPFYLANTSSGKPVYVFPPFLTVGRANSDLLLNDVTISRNHAKIEINPFSLTLTDLSKFGSTKVNHQSIAIDTTSKTRAIELFPGDEIIFGGLKYPFIVKSDIKTFLSVYETERSQGILKSFEKKTLHTIMDSYEDSVEFVICDDFEAALHKPDALLALVAGKRFLAMEYCKAFEAIKSGADTLIEMEPFEIFKQANDRKGMLQSTEIMLEGAASCYEKVVTLLGATVVKSPSPSAQTLVVAEEEDFNRHLCSHRILSIKEFIENIKNMVDLPWGREVIVEEIQPEIHPNEKEILAWISPLRLNEENQTSLKPKILPMKEPEDFLKEQNTSKKQKLSLEDPNTDFNDSVSFTQWRSNTSKTSSAWNSDKNGDFF
jgi:FHA domain